MCIRDSCGTFSEQSWPTIGNLLDRRLVQYFCTITTVTRYLVYYMNRIWTLLFLDERHPKEYQRVFSLEIHGERKAYVCKQKHLLLQRTCIQNIQLQFHWLSWMDFIAFFACVTCHFHHANQRTRRGTNDHHNNKLLLSGNPKKRPNFEVSPLTRFHWAPLGANHIREHRELAHFRPGVWLWIGVSWRSRRLVDLGWFAF